MYKSYSRKNREEIITIKVAVAATEVIVTEKKKKNKVHSCKEQPSFYSFNLYLGVHKNMFIKW